MNKERASKDKTSNLKKLATDIDTTKPRKRATYDESPIISKRATPSETPISLERVKEGKTSTRAKRARAVETTMNTERAKGAEITKIRERAILIETPTARERPSFHDVLALRMMARAREDFQSMRKRMDNRLGRKADGTEQDIAERAFRSDDVESFASVADASHTQEAVIEKLMLGILRRFPVYTEYLHNIKGVGTIAASWIIAEFDIHKADTVSKLWQFCGLNPGMVQGKKDIPKSEYKTGQIVREYESKRDGSQRVVMLTDDRVRGDRLTPGYVAPFNKRLRTAMVGVLADGFIKAQAPYALEFYYPYKERLEQSDNACPTGKSWKDESKGHRDRAAKRYMIKMFLRDLYIAWRSIEGLPVRPPYQEEYLGKRHAV